MQSTQRVSKKNKKQTSLAEIILCGMMGVVVLLFLVVAIVPWVGWPGELRGLKLFPMSTSATLPAESQVPRAAAKVEVERKIYHHGDKLLLNVYNEGSESIFLEPCGELSRWQQMKQGRWQEQTVSSADLKTFAASTAIEDAEHTNFKAQKHRTTCELMVPAPLEAGIYRLVVSVHYGCTDSAASACDRVEKLYTTSFEVQTKPSTVTAK